MQFAKVNGVTLHYQVIGAEGRPTLVFSNSLGTDFRIWRDVIVRLVGDYSILLYDKRGHGLSDIGITPYSMDDHANDLAALMDLLEIKNAIICGLSVGGMIAQTLYSKRRELVRALILSDTAHKIGDEAMWNDRIKTIDAEGIPAQAEAILERWFTPNFRENEKEAFAGFGNMLRRSPHEGYIATCHALRDADLTNEARNIAVPTICIVGDQDGATPPDLMLETAKLIPDARYEVISGAGHLPCIEQPEIFVEIVRAFLAEAQVG